MGVEKPLEWLPSGWTMDVRVRTKGATAGSKDKYYIERLTGKKFRSKVQINRYLKSKELENPLNPNRGCMENIQSRGCELFPKFMVKKTGTIVSHHIEVLNDQWSSGAQT